MLIYKFFAVFSVAVCQHLMIVCCRLSTFDDRLLPSVNIWWLFYRCESVGAVFPCEVLSAWSHGHQGGNHQVRHHHLMSLYALLPRFQILQTTPVWTIGTCVDPTYATYATYVTYATYGTHERTQIEYSLISRFIQPSLTYPYTGPRVSFFVHFVT